MIKVFSFDTKTNKLMDTYDYDLDVDEDVNYKYASDLADMFLGDKKGVSQIDTLETMSKPKGYTQTDDGYSTRNNLACSSYSQPYMLT